MTLHASKLNIKDDSNPTQSEMSRPLLLRRKMMKRTIEGLWRGKIIPQEGSCTNSNEMKVPLGH